MEQGLSTCHNRKSREPPELVDYHYCACGNSNTFPHERFCLTCLCRQYLFWLELNGELTYVAYPLELFYHISGLQQPWLPLLKHPLKWAFAHTHGLPLSQRLSFVMGANDPDFQSGQCQADFQPKAFGNFHINGAFYGIFAVRQRAVQPVLTCFYLDRKVLPLQPAPLA